jgi:hypothetical protein
MKLEEIEVLRNLQEYLQNKIDAGCHKLNYNDLMHDFKVVDAISSIETVLQELEHLQKENEELKDIDLTIVHLKGDADEKDRWRNKIREKIKEIYEDKNSEYYDMFLEQRDIEKTISILNDLLKEE